MLPGRWLVAGALLALALPGQSPASPPRTCPDAIFAFEGAPILTSPLSSTRTDAIVLDEGTVAIVSGCEAARASIQKGRNGWRVRVSWKECSGVTRVRLKATISPDCGQMTGTVEMGRPRTVRTFTARACTDPVLCDIPCANDQECPAGAYCRRDVGDCQGEGTCALRGRACPAIWIPVCGCDGHTYSSACEAEATGVNVASTGMCDIPCDVASPCGSGQFCELPPGVCASNLDQGRCVEIPDLCQNDICGTCSVPPCPLCPNVYQPVCGCDGTTYASECERRRAGVSKSFDGPCGCKGITCRNGMDPVDLDNDGCPEVCLARCDTACDCTVNPDIYLRFDCPLDCDECGDYWSCETGHCVDQCGIIPNVSCPICGGISGQSCGPGEICDLPPGQCASADLWGLCRARAEACPAFWDPVCGCDGVTYGNDCQRLSVGAQKAHDGECGR